MDALGILGEINEQLNNEVHSAQQMTTPQTQPIVQPQTIAQPSAEISENMLISPPTGEVPEYVDGLTQSVENIFAAVIAGGVDRTNIALIQNKHAVFKQAYPKFKSMYSKNIFTNEYAFFYSVLTTLKIPFFTWEQLEIVINNSADDILTSDRIDLSSFATFNGIATTDEEKLEAFKYLVSVKFNELSNKYVTVEEYDSACAIYNACYKESEMTKLINDMAIIMASGLTKRVGAGRKRIWKGADDAQEYYRRQKAEIYSFEDDSKRVTSERIDEKWLARETDGTTDDEKEALVDTGLSEIDSIHGALHRGNMFETMGPPKGGKTTFTAYLVARCLAKGLNVAIWPLEGTKAEWTSAIEANIIRAEGRKGVNKKKLLEEQYDTEEDKQLAIAAKTKMAIGQGRGKLSFITGICYVEDMQDELMGHYNTENAFDVIVMDSPVLVLSRTPGKSKPDRIGEAYTTMKNFINNVLPRKALALVTAQLKQTVVDQIRQDPSYEIEVTAGGESAETIRTPDYIVCLVSTPEERRNNLCKFHDVAVRHTENFKTFYCRAEFGCATFTSDSGLNSL